jgi:hypothetical protein
MANVTPRKVQSIGNIFVECNNSKPTQLVSGPGNTGKKDPIIPKQTKTKPKSSKNISIVIFNNDTSHNSKKMLVFLIPKTNY